MNLVEAIRLLGDECWDFIPGDETDMCLPFVSSHFKPLSRVKASPFLRKPLTYG